MIKVGVKVTGLKEMNRALTELGTKHGRAALRVAIRAGGKVITEEVSRRAPVGTVQHSFKEFGQRVTVQPGNLKKSIKSRFLRSKGVYNGNIQLVIPLEGRAFYGKFQEFGWWAGKTRSHSYKGANGRRGRRLNDEQRADRVRQQRMGRRYVVPKKRFFEPAWEAKRNEALMRIRERLWDRIQYEAARLGAQNAR